MHQAMHGLRGRRSQACRSPSRDIQGFQIRQHRPGTPTNKYTTDWWDERGQTSSDCLVWLLGLSGLVAARCSALRAASPEEGVDLSGDILVEHSEYVLVALGHGDAGPTHDLHDDARMNAK